MYFLQTNEIEISVWIKTKIYLSVNLSVPRNTVPTTAVKTRTNINNANTLFLVRFIITYKIIYMRESLKNK